MLTLPLLASAQYMVVDANGNVTFTDRPPATGTVTPIRLRGVRLPPEQDPTLPRELREAAQDFPVVLYTGASCTPCDSGRQLLVDRGIPFSEKRVESAADIAAFEALSGARNLPLLSVGSRRLQGLVVAQWTSSLTAAGYPIKNSLPKDYVRAAAQPLSPAPSASAAALPNAQVSMVPAATDSSKPPIQF